MSILLQEIALRYTEQDGKKMFWDFYATYALWTTVGSEAMERGGTPTAGNRSRIVDELWHQVALAFADKVLNFLQEDGFALKEHDDKVKKVIVKLGRKLMHARKVEDYNGIYAAINDLFRINEKDKNIFRQFDGRLDVGATEIQIQRRIGNNPARYLTYVSPLVAQILKANMHYFVGYDQAPQEADKEKLVVNAARGEFTAEEVDTLINIGMSVYGAGNSAAKTTSYTIHLDKLKDGTYLVFLSDKSIIEIFKTLFEATQYVYKNYRTRLPRFGIKLWHPPQKPAAPIAPDAAADASNAPAPTAPIPAAPEPTVPKQPQYPLPANDKLTMAMGGNEPKRAQGIADRYLTGLGYAWNEAEKAYINPERNIKVQVMPDNSAKVTKPDGSVKGYQNLGLLMRAMNHAIKARHAAHKSSPKKPHAAPVSAGEPATELKEAHFKTLYKFLYS